MREECDDVRVRVGRRVRHVHDIVRDAAGDQLAFVPPGEWVALVLHDRRHHVGLRDPLNLTLLQTSAEAAAEHQRQLPLIEVPQTNGADRMLPNQINNR